MAVSIAPIVTFMFLRYSWTDCLVILDQDNQLGRAIVQGVVREPRFPSLARTGPVSFPRLVDPPSESSVDPRFRPRLTALASVKRPLAGLVVRLHPELTH
jgi:hypothetical protein